MATPRFEVFASRDGYRWRLKDANNEIVATSEAYTTKASARRGAENVKTTAPAAQVVDV